MMTVMLYGHLKRFGKKHVLDIRTPAEAIRALCATVQGFRAHVINHSEPGYRVLTGKTDRAAGELHDPASAQEVIKIVPIVAGAGGGFGKIIIGAALIGAAMFVPGLQEPMFTTGLGGELFGAMTAGELLGSIGMALVLGGAAQLLTPTPKAPDSVERPENKPSYLFDGAVNTAAQGAAVPIAYGKIMAGSVVISSGLSTA